MSAPWEISTLSSRAALSIGMTSRLHWFTFKINLLHWLRSMLGKDQSHSIRRKSPHQRMIKRTKVQPWNKWTKGSRGGRSGGRGGRGGRGGCGGRGGDREEAGSEFDPKNPGKYLSKKAWFKLSDEQMELSRKENPPKKRNISAFKMVRVSAASSGDRTDQVSDLSARKTAAVASVMAAKNIPKKLMDEKELDSHADIAIFGPTLMDKLTPAEAAMKPAAKPTPAPKKKSSLCLCL